MNLLLDTHILLWAANGSLPEKAEEIISNLDNRLFFSSSAIWEVSIKNELGRADFKVDPLSLYQGLIASGYEELPVTGRHTLVLSSLPQIHKDPFDRIMLAQALVEGLTFLTSDETVAKYPSSILYISS